ncbi:MAG: hypothetical protein ABI220_05900 [Candidatus Saccharimonadales bacterium]
MSQTDNNIGLNRLPAVYDSLSSKDLLQQFFPFVWQPRLKAVMWFNILSRSPEQDEASQQLLDDRMRLVAKYCIMSPGVSTQVDGLINWRVPEVFNVVHDSEADDLEKVQGQFETAILGISAGTEYQKSWIHASGIIVPGSYPTKRFANAFRTTPELFLQRLKHYSLVGPAVLARTGPYLT